MNPKAGEHRCSELSGLDVEISARYHWSIARQLTSYSLRHWNLRNLTLQQECYLTKTRDFFHKTHGSINNNAAASPASHLKLNNRHVSGMAMSIVSKQNWNLDLSDLVFVEIAKIKKLVKILTARTRTSNNGLSPGKMPNPELKPRTQ